MVSEYVTIVTFLVAILDASNYSYLLWVVIVCCGLLLLIRLSPMPNDIDSDENKSAMIIAYGAVSLSGFIIGLLSGWIFWG